MAIFKRKIYSRLLQWKENGGKTALLIEGARRIGKSTIARTFAENEYDSYVLIDFSIAPREVIELFDNIANLNEFFTRLQFEFGISLTPRKSLIIFDEVQFCPRARQAIKHLVADGRFDYIETGSLISIRKNVKDILIPSEEERIDMYPLDYEEFRWALGDTATCNLLREALCAGRPLGDALNRKLMRDFRLYMLIGGMPQAINEYLDSLDLMKVDEVKRGIISLYEADFRKIDSYGRMGRLFDNVPGQLANGAKRYMPHTVLGNTSPDVESALIAELADSKTVQLCHHAADPAGGLSISVDKDYFKIYLTDTGLFITLAFKDKQFTDNIIYNKLLSDKLRANLGFVYENAVAQILSSAGHRLFYYTFPTENRHSCEIDFLLGSGDKIDPIEVKSSSYRSHVSLDRFCDKYSAKVRTPLVIYTKDMAKEGTIRYIPIYMLPFLVEQSRNS